MLEYQLVDYHFTSASNQLLYALEQNNSATNQQSSLSIYENIYYTFFPPPLKNNTPDFKLERLKLLVFLFETDVLKPETLDIVQHELCRLSQALRYCEEHDETSAREILYESFSIVLFKHVATDINMSASALPLGMV